MIGIKNSFGLVLSDGDIILYEKWMQSIVEDGIVKNELKPEAKELIMGIFSFA